MLLAVHIIAPYSTVDSLMYSQCTVNMNVYTHVYAHVDTHVCAPAVASVDHRLY